MPETIASLEEQRWQLYQRERPDGKGSISKGNNDNCPSGTISSRLFPLRGGLRGSKIY